MAVRTWVSRSSSTGSLNLSGSPLTESNGSFTLGSKVASANVPINSIPRVLPRWVPSASILRRALLQVGFLTFFITVSLYASVAVEDVAKKMAGGQQTKLSKRAQELISLVGTGHLEQQQPVVLVQQYHPHSKLKPRQQDWRKVPIKEKLPVVVIASHVPNEPNHPAIRVLKQARLMNDLVYLLGPRNHRHLRNLDVFVEPKEIYNETIGWVWDNIGHVQMDVFRWWMLRAFMQRHGFERVMLISVEVMLYTNATEWAAWLFPETRVALPVRWPSLQPPALPSQYTSTAVSAHIGLWSLEALSDFVEFWKVVVDVALFGGGEPGSRELIKRKEYRDSNVLGWYSFPDCWVDPNLDPPCMAEAVVGITPKLAAKLRNKFTPKFSVESLCQPRWCQNSTWSDFGLCVFDNNFSVGTPSRFFKFSPKDKCPSSKLYEHYDAWMGGAPKRTVQFLSVHFQGSRRDYLKLEDPDPSKSWGSSPF